MRVAIDARELCGRPTGVGRYLAGLLEAWGDNATAQRHQWTLYAHARPAVSNRRWDPDVRVLAGGGGTGWEQFSLPRALSAERPDVLFSPGYTAPLTVAAPIVLTVHDVSFFAHPEWFSFREGTRRRFLTAWSARRARKVVTDSEFSKSEIVRHIGLDASRIKVISLGVDKPHPGSRLPGPGSREPMVLYVGSIFERRRVDKLIEAFDLVAAQVPAATLEIVGENRTRRPRLDLEALRARTAHPDRIHLHAYVDDQALRALYQRASVLAFLSEYEGFGFTPLEALAAGVAPLVLDTLIARETCADAARYVPPAAPVAEVARAMTELLTNAPARRDILQRATAVLARYDWDLAAGDTLKVLEEAALGR
jgi:glycosyltransferase involved in cell wall biosynthesis